MFAARPDTIRDIRQESTAKDINHGIHLVVVEQTCEADAVLDAMNSMIDNISKTAVSSSCCRLP